jgi:hypothetical protein
MAVVVFDSGVPRIAIDDSSFETTVDCLLAFSTERGPRGTSGTCAHNESDNLPPRFTSPRGRRRVVRGHEKLRRLAMARGCLARQPNWGIGPESHLELDTQQVERSIQTLASVGLQRISLRADFVPARFLATFHFWTEVLGVNETAHVGVRLVLGAITGLLPGSLAVPLCAQAAAPARDLRPADQVAARKVVLAQSDLPTGFALALASKSVHIPWELPCTGYDPLYRRACSSLSHSARKGSTTQ